MIAEGFALWPGAGSDRDHHSLVAIEHDLAPLPVGRFDFPYRREGRRPPDRANKLILSLRDDVDQFCAELGIGSDRLLIGGRSMGGRMCSMAAAGATGATAKAAEKWTAPLPVAGVVLLGYPLHPPGRPDRMRTEHLDRLDVPLLFISGDRDPFGTPAELAEALTVVPGPVTSVTIPGARHELAGCDERIVEIIRSWMDGSVSGSFVDTP